MAKNKVIAAANNTRCRVSNSDFISLFVDFIRTLLAELDQCTYSHPLMFRLNECHFIYCVNQQGLSFRRDSFPRRSPPRPHFLLGRAPAAAPLRIPCCRIGHANRELRQPLMDCRAGPQPVATPRRLNTRRQRAATLVHGSAFLRSVTCKSSRWRPQCPSFTLNGTSSNTLGSSIESGTGTRQLRRGP
jgi:hypothetical protein